MELLNFEKRSTLIVWAIVIYVAIGGFFLNMSQESIKGQTAQVWVQVQRGTELLPRLESLVSREMSDRKELMTLLAQSRTNLAEAQKKGDLDLAVGALTSGLKVIAEDNNIPSGVDKLQIGLLDETSGTYNRLSYARGKLVDAQRGYNQTRIFFPLDQPVFPRVSILGENSDPSEKIPMSSFQ
jgi:hypothetical protein